MNIVTNGASKPLDGIAVCAFALAFFLMIMPVEADIAVSLMLSNHYAHAFAFASACFVAVLVPVFASWRRQYAQPDRWRGRGYLVAATAILVVNALVTATTIVHNIRK